MAVGGVIGSAVPAFALLLLLAGLVLNHAASGAGRSSGLTRA
jgi:hypothetical protein